MLLELFHNEKFVKVFQIIIILTIIFAIIQIFRIVFGGSWSIEEVILVIVGANLAGTMALISKYSGIRSDMKHLRKDVDCMKRDNKKFNNDLNDIKLELKLLAQKIK